MTRQEKRAGTVASGARVLVSGASFAGLATGWWLARLGYRVTIVEIAPGLRKGGTPVDIKPGAIEGLRRMGLLEAVRARSLPPRRIEVRNGDGTVAFAFPPRPFVPDGPDEQYEIDRDMLLDVLFEAVAPDVEIRFGRSIAQLEEVEGGVSVRFEDGERQVFALVFGCDGMRSRTRRLVFGEGDTGLYFLKKYGFLKVVPGRIIEPDVTQIYTVKGRSVMVNGYSDKTDIGFGFHAEEELEYDYRDKARKRRLVIERFERMGGRTAELLDMIGSDDDFYFDKICQVRLSAWSRGRVVLVGDAGYCLSPFAGMGGSMAIMGAVALHDAFRRHGSDFMAAFREYEATLRPFVEKEQEHAADFGRVMFAPESDEVLEERDRRLREMRR